MPLILYWSIMWSPTTEILTTDAEWTNRWKGNHSHMNVFANLFYGTGDKLEEFKEKKNALCSLRKNASYETGFFSVSENKMFL